MVVETCGRVASRGAGDSRDSSGPVREGTLNPMGREGPERSKAFQGITHKQVSHAVVGDYGPPYWKGYRSIGMKRKTQLRSAKVWLVFVGRETL